MTTAHILPRRQAGRCRYCDCTQWVPCPQGCAWIDEEQTVCSAELCVAFFLSTLMHPAAVLAL